MEKSYSLILILFLVFCSCRKQKTVQKPDIKTSEVNETLESVPVEKKIIKKQKQLKKQKRETFIVRDSIVRSWRKELQNISNLELIFQIKTKPFPNKHNKNVIDTIKTLTFDKSKFVFYKNEKFENLIESRIRNPEISINHLTIGTNGVYLDKTLAYGFDGDSIVVGNMERTILFTFKLEKGLIKSIDFKGYID